MTINFNPALPIYTQIMDGIRQDICRGALSPGEKVPSVRELACELGVNPNTLQRALTDLEREGLLYTERTSGRFVTKDQGLIDKVRLQMMLSLTEEYRKKMASLGCSGEELIKLLNGEMENER